MCAVYPKRSRGQRTATGKSRKGEEVSQSATTAERKKVAENNGTNRDSTSDSRGNCRPRREQTCDRFSSPTFLMPFSYFVARTRCFDGDQVADYRIRVFAAQILFTYFSLVRFARHAACSFKFRLSANDRYDFATFSRRIAARLQSIRCTYAFRGLSTRHAACC